MGAHSLYSMLYFPWRITPGVMCQGLLRLSLASEMGFYLFPILSLSGGMRWTLTCGPTVGCSLLFGRHGETEAQCGTQRCMGILRDVGTLSPMPCSAGFCLPSPSLATHHALGHTWYWLRKQWGRGHTDTPYPSVGPFPVPPALCPALRGPSAGCCAALGSLRACAWLRAVASGLCRCLGEHHLVSS